MTCIIAEAVRPHQVLHRPTAHPQIDDGGSRRPQSSKVSPHNSSSLRVKRRPDETPRLMEISKFKNITFNICAASFTELFSAPLKFFGATTPINRFDLDVHFKRVNSIHGYDNSMVYLVAPRTSYIRRCRPAAPVMPARDMHVDDYSTSWITPSKKKTGERHMRAARHGKQQHQYHQYRKHHSLDG
jgi:hypothetical protein